jgi:hypothetical protein
VSLPAPSLPQGEVPAPGYDKENSWWLETTFELPFMYTLGMEPAAEEHTLIALPLLRRDRTAEIRAWINGEPLEVRSYQYPRNPAFGCYWADLVGTAARRGENRLVVYYRARRK